jgi:ribonuclease HI
MFHGWTWIVRRGDIVYYLCGMAKKKEKFYTVWEGVTPGVYRTWEECQLQTKGYSAPKFKSFDTLEEAEEALSQSYYSYMGTKKGGTVLLPTDYIDPSSPLPYIDNSLAVDAACSGNPGMMEYRGVHVASRQQMFHFGPTYGTNNIGEFLAIVHALALLQQKGYDMPIYTDSVNAINWVRQKKCKTKLPRNERTEQLFCIIDRAEKWLHEHTYNTPILKWETKAWGEIPADFGRKR